MSNPTARTVRANISITLDGRYNGPEGPGDLSAIVPYAVTDLARDHLTRVYEGATTVLLGRGSAQGFLGYWFSVADDETAAPGRRGYAQWLVNTDKVVFSSSLTEGPWERTCVRNGPVAHVIAE